MAKSDNNSPKPLRIASPPKDVYEYVSSRMQVSLRSAPKELIAIIREHKELTSKKK